MSLQKPPEPLLHLTGEVPLLPGLPEPRHPLGLLPLRVEHNLSDQRAAVLAAQQLGPDLPPELMETLVEHSEELGLLKEGEEVLGGLEEGGPEVNVEVIGDKLKKLVHVQRTSRVHGLSKELDELVCYDGVDPVLLRLPEGGGDLPLVLLEEDNLLLDDKLLGISGQKVFELLDVLAGDVSHLQQSFQLYNLI